MKGFSVGSLPSGLNAPGYIEGSTMLSRTARIRRHVPPNGSTGGLDLRQASGKSASRLSAPEEEGA